MIYWVLLIALCIAKSLFQQYWSYSYSKYISALPFEIKYTHGCVLLGKQNDQLSTTTKHNKAYTIFFDSDMMDAVENEAVMYGKTFFFSETMPIM